MFAYAHSKDDYDVTDELDTWKAVWGEPSSKESGLYPIGVSKHPLVTRQFIEAGLGPQINEVDSEGNIMIFRLFTQQLNDDATDVECCRLVAPYVDMMKRGRMDLLPVHFIRHPLMFDALVMHHFPDAEARRAYLQEVDEYGRTVLHTSCEDYIGVNFFKLWQLDNYRTHLISWEMENAINDESKSSAIIAHYSAKFDKLKSQMACPLSHFKRIIEEGADVNFATKAGNTPLASLVYSLNAQDGATEAPEHEQKMYIPSLQGVKDVVDILLRAGADPYHKNKNGESPYTYIKWCKEEGISYRRTLGRSIYYQNLCILSDEIYKMFHRCHYCHTTGPTKTCSGCERVWYCSAEHQKADWGAHKAFCRAHPVEASSASASASSTAKNKSKTKNRTRKNGGRRRSFI
jgi:hypothetical protein